MRRLWLGCITIWVGLLASAQAQDMQGIYNSVNSSVVAIYRQMPSDDLTAKREMALTGVIVSGKGLVVTCAEGVVITTTPTVKLWNGDLIPARVLSVLPDVGIALLQLTKSPPTLPFSPPADSDKSAPGDPIVVPGLGTGDGELLSIGYIAGKYGQKPLEYLRLDARVHKANAGAPVINSKSELIGIVSPRHTKEDGLEGLGVAVSSNTIKELLLKDQQ